MFAETGIDRCFYEICLLYAIRDCLRSGDLWVAGSKQYRDFEGYLLSASAWQEMQVKQELPVAVNCDFSSYFSQRAALLNEQLKLVSSLLEKRQLADVTLENQRLKISPLDSVVPEVVEPLARKK